MKQKIEIEYPDGYGEKWLSIESLTSFFTTSAHVSENISIAVRDVTEDPPVVSRLYGGHDGDYAEGHM